MSSYFVIEPTQFMPYRRFAILMPSGRTKVQMSRPEGTEVAKPVGVYLVRKNRRGHVTFERDGGVFMRPFTPNHIKPDRAGE